MAITFNSVRKISKEPQNGDGVAFIERVPLQQAIMEDASNGIRDHKGEQ